MARLPRSDRDRTPHRILFTEANEGNEESHDRWALLVLFVNFCLFLTEVTKLWFHALPSRLAARV